MTSRPTLPVTQNFRPMRYKYHRQIQPKLSAIPRQKSQANLYRNSYLLEVEKNRLTEELEVLQSRSHIIEQRLALIEDQLGELEKDVTELSVPPSPKPPNNLPVNNPEPPPQSNPTNSSHINTFMVDY